MRVYFGEGRGEGRRSFESADRTQNNGQSAGYLRARLWQIYQIKHPHTPSARPFRPASAVSRARSVSLSLYWFTANWYSAGIIFSIPHSFSLSLSRTISIRRFRQRGFYTIFIASRSLGFFFPPRIKSRMYFRVAYRFPRETLRGIWGSLKSWGIFFALHYNTHTNTRAISFSSDYLEVWVYRKSIFASSTSPIHTHRVLLERHKKHVFAIRI